jgi:uncharacterized membrane protein YfcA
LLYLWLPLIGLLASAFSTVAGFGAGIVLISFASTFMDIKEVVPISTMYFLGLSATQMLVFRKSLDWKTVLLYCGGALPGILVGMAVFDVLPAAQIKLGLAVLVLGYCANMLLKLIPERLPSSQVTVAVSAVAGLVDAVTASGGTIQAPLFLARGLRKEVFVASFAATSVLLNPLKIGLYWTLGYFQPGNLPLVALLVVSGFAGVQIGRLGLKRLSPESFRILAVAFLFLLGLKLLVESCCA